MSVLEKYVIFLFFAGVIFHTIITKCCLLKTPKPRCSLSTVFLTNLICFNYVLVNLWVRLSRCVHRVGAGRWWTARWAVIGRDQEAELTGRKRKLACFSFYFNIWEWNMQHAPAICGDDTLRPPGGDDRTATSYYNALYDSLSLQLALLLLLLLLLLMASGEILQRKTGLNQDLTKT